MKKRLLALLLSGVVMSMSLSACGSVSTKDTTETSQSEETEDSAEDTEEEEETEETEEEEDTDSAEEDATEAEDTDSADAELESKEPVIDVSDEVKAKLDALETDYNKVKWDYVTTPFDDEDIVVSTSTKKWGVNYTVFVAVTNLKDIDYDLDIVGHPLDLMGETIDDEEIFIDDLAVGSGNTILYWYDMTVPTEGEISWEKNESHEPYRHKFCPYTVEWEDLGKDDLDRDEIEISLSADDRTESIEVMGVTVDEDKNIIGCGYAFEYDNYSGDFNGIMRFESVTGRDVVIEKADVALFVNPIGDLQ